MVLLDESVARIFQLFVKVSFQTMPRNPAGTFLASKFWFVVHVLPIRVQLASGIDPRLTGPLAPPPMTKTSVKLWLVVLLKAARGMRSPRRFAGPFMSDPLRPPVLSERIVDVSDVRGSWRKPAADRDTRFLAL